MAFIRDQHDGIFWKDPASKLPLSLSVISVEGENYCKVVIYRDKLPHEYVHVVEVPSYYYHFDPGGTCFFYDKLKFPDRATTKTRCPGTNSQSTPEASTTTTWGGPWSFSTQGTTFPHTGPVPPLA